MRFLLALVVRATAAAGCDTAGPDVVAPGDVLVVDLVAEAAAQTVVTVVTEGTPGGATPSAYRTRVSLGVLTVEVDGLEVRTGPACRARVPSSFAVAVPSPAGSGLEIEVRHRGATDRYEIRNGQAGPVLVPVRTSVTRPGPR